MRRSLSLCVESSRNTALAIGFTLKGAKNGGFRLGRTSPLISIVTISGPLNWGCVAEAKLPYALRSVLALEDELSVDRRCSRRDVLANSKNQDDRLTIENIAYTFQQVKLLESFQVD